jgi:hypothetical protein
VQISDEYGTGVRILSAVIFYCDIIREARAYMVLSALLFSFFIKTAILG